MEKTNNPWIDPALARKARLLLISTTVLWGISFPLTRSLELAQRPHAPHVSYTSMAFADVGMRFGIAALFLLPIYGRGLVNVTAREWSQGLGLACFAGIGTCLQNLGLAWTDASIAAFLTQLYTLIVPLIVAVRDRRAPTLRVVIASVMVLVGAALLSPGLLRHFILGPGEWAVIIGAGFLAGQIVWVERPLYEKNRPGVITLVMFIALAVTFTGGFFVMGGTPQGAVELFGTTPLASLSLAIVLLCTVTNFLIMNAWQRRVTATEAGLIYCIEPVIAATLSSFLPGWLSSLAGIAYPNETLSWTLLIGGLLIVSATVLVATEKKKS